MKAKRSRYGVYVEIKQGQHTMRIPKGTQELITELFQRADFGDITISAFMEKQIKGTSFTRGVKVKGYLHHPQGRGVGSVRISVQPGANDTCIPYLIPVPRGLDGKEFFDRLVKAAPKVGTDDRTDNGLGPTVSQERVAVGLPEESVESGSEERHPSEPEPPRPRPPIEQLIGKEGEQSFGPKLSRFFEKEPERVRIALEAIINATGKDDTIEGKVVTQVLEKTFHFDAYPVHAQRQPLTFLARFGYLKKAGDRLYKVTEDGLNVAAGTVQPHFVKQQRSAGVVLSLPAKGRRFSGDRITDELVVLEEIVAQALEAAKLIRKDEGRREKLQKLSERLTEKVKSLNEELGKVNHERLDLTEQVRKRRALIEQGNSAREKLERVRAALREP